MFRLHAPYQPAGDQPRAIELLTAGVRAGLPHQTLLGVTGSGKTFTIANVIANVNKPTLVISHNKTLAAQLYQEYRDFFPENAVSYFVSYYDYYQPEAYIPQTDTYIEKETEVNELIDKLRLQATMNLLTRKDVVVVASISCIYNLGSPREYERNLVTLRSGDDIDRRRLFTRLTEIQYRRSQTEFHRGMFRVRGEVIDIWPASEDVAVRLDLTGTTLSRITWIDPVSADVVPNRGSAKSIVISPAKHYLTDPQQYADVFASIQKDLDQRLRVLGRSGKTLEAHRLEQRVRYDLEMLREVGYVNGVENYSRYFEGRRPGDPPHTLLDYFRECDRDFLTIIDESHMTIPQLKGMYHGDQSRKQTLVDYGFRLPSALDNRPLTLPEFLDRVGQIIYTSATPSEWEISRSRESALQNNKQKTRNKSQAVVEQVIRPTGLIDPEIEVRSADNQIPDLVIEIITRKRKGERVLVTTLTKRTAEVLAEYLSDESKLRKILAQYREFHRSEFGDAPAELQLPRATYLHSDVHTLDRQDILDDLRLGNVDVIIGINLLREGLDLPEVSLVAILDADKEGFLRSKTSLIQTMGRAARHAQGKVILYSYRDTFSMTAAIGEVNRRRKIQIDYNLQHGIMPVSIQKPIREKLVDRPPDEPVPVDLPAQISKRYRVNSLPELEIASLTPADRKVLVRHLTRKMLSAADRLDFESAAAIRDQIRPIEDASKNRR